MQKPEDYRNYAEECERLAKQLPNHAQALLEMAKAWRRLASQSERGTPQSES